LAIYIENNSRFDIESAVEIPGWGQIPPNIIEDAVTHAGAAWHQGGALAALFHYRTDLEHLIAQNTWRTADAADMLAFLEQEAALSFPIPVQLPKDQVSLLSSC
jgi:hypothetical protein